MSTQKRKFELFARLQALGFTYEEAVSLRRIEMTLGRWAKAECNGEIERNEATGKPERVSQAYINGYSSKRTAWPVADREAGALRRLASLLADRNTRNGCGDSPSFVYAYHQTDPRGCSLYLITREQLTEKYGTERQAKGALLPMDQYYNRGLAVCA